MFPGSGRRRTTPGNWPSPGKERLASLRHDAAFRAAVDLPSSDSAWQALVRTWHALKTDIYLGMVERGELDVRVGVRRLAREAVESGWALAVASSGSVRSVRSVVRHALGDELAVVTVIVAGDSVGAKKPPRMSICRPRRSWGPIPPAAW